MKNRIDSYLKEYLTSVQKSYLSMGVWTIDTSFMHENWEKHQYSDESLRKRYSAFIKNWGSLREVPDFETFKNEFTEAKELRDKYFTKYEDIGYATILHRNQESAIEGFKLMNLLPKRKLLFGTLPLGELNACAINTGNHGSIIVLNVGIFTLINQLSNLVALTLIEGRTDDGRVYHSTSNIAESREKILTNDFFRKTFSDIFISYITKGSANLSERFDVQPPLNVFTIIVASTIEIFMMSHEIAHVILHHENRSRVNMKELGLEFPESWAKEFESDTVAMLTTAHPERSDKIMGLGLKYLGIKMFFLITETIYMILNADNFESHPHPSLRANYLMEKMIYEAPPDSVEDILLHNQFIETVFKSFWEVSKDTILSNPEIKNKAYNK